MNTLTFAGIGAAVTAGWGWLRAIWSQFLSLFLVEIEMDRQLSPVFVHYCMQTMRTFPRRRVRYDSFSDYVRSQGGVRFLAYEGNHAPPILFARGWRLLWVDKQGEGAAHAVFLRGTFNIESMILEATREHHKHTSTKNHGSRFRVIRMYGRDSGEKIRSEGVASSAPVAEDYQRVYMRRYLGYSRDDIGAPTSAEPFQHLQYQDEVLAFREHVRVWYQAQDWYRSRKIAWRLSGLFLSAPGNGKTSCVRALGQEFDLPVYALDVAGMTNEEFASAYHRALENAPAIILLEDFDRVDFTQQDTMRPRLTMDCVLNSIAGVDSSDGILLVVTANDVTKLDAALLRPGRLDIHIRFQNPTTDAKRRIAERILEGCGVLVDDVVEDGANDTGAEFEFRCQALALKAFWKRPVVTGDPVLMNPYEEVKRFDPEMTPQLHAAAKKLDSSLRCTMSKATRGRSDSVVNYP